MDHPSAHREPHGGVPLAEERVLSTLEQDGSRRWLTPKLSKGSFLNRRRVVAYALIGLYTALPFVHVDGKPWVLLDVPARRFTLFGFTFLPTDTVLLALSLVGILLGIFMLTALFGRIWCGWACPQTVYMEFLIRPIERLFDGTRGRGGVPRRPPSFSRTVGKYATYGVVCFLLANTFLAYFVGVKTLAGWMTQSPLHRPLPFVIMASVTALMLLDFAYFREQMCTLACPYGRLQSVLLDRNSVIISYDARRGEPRGAVRKTSSRSLPVLGDCIDCKLCVQTCPTGIDIREGLQMECVSCAQCIDACDRVMAKLGRTPRLIGYSSQARDAGVPTRLLRARTIIYPLILVAIAVALVSGLVSRPSFDAVLLRNPGQPFSLTDDGEVRNVLKLKVTNRTQEELPLTLELESLGAVELATHSDRIILAAGESETVPFTVRAPHDAFESGQLRATLHVHAADGSTRTLDCRLLGPLRPPRGPP
jgi:cytochrome c oxidase accessory protein FixG